MMISAALILQRKELVTGIGNFCNGYFKVNLTQEDMQRRDTAKWLLSDLCLDEDLGPPFCPSLKSVKAYFTEKGLSLNHYPVLISGLMLKGPVSVPHRDPFEFWYGVRSSYLTSSSC